MPRMPPPPLPVSGTVFQLTSLLFSVAVAPKPLAIPPPASEAKFFVTTALFRGNVPERFTAPPPTAPPPRLVPAGDSYSIESQSAAGAAVDGDDPEARAVARDRCVLAVDRYRGDDDRKAVAAHHHVVRRRQRVRATGSEIDR